MQKGHHDHSDNPVSADRDAHHATGHTHSHHHGHAHEHSKGHGHPHSHGAHSHDHDHGRSHHHGHGHDHGHGHGHGAHDHGTEIDSSNQKRVLAALCLTGFFMVVEAIGGFWSGSLALIADAGHMLTDTAALALAYLAFQVAGRPNSTRYSYGEHRFQVLAAFVNGAALVGIAVWIVIEAAHRLFNPVPVMGWTMMGVAVLGLMVNVAAFFILHGGDRENLNMQGAALHVLGDLLGSVAAVVAALVILATGWTPIDPILSVLVALLVLRSAWILVAKSWHILMEGAPDGVEVSEIKAACESIAGVRDVHHIHLWQLTPRKVLITLHAHVDHDQDGDEVLRQLHHLLKDRFNLTHATIQIERQPDCVSC